MNEVIVVGVMNAGDKGTNLFAIDKITSPKGTGYKYAGRNENFAYKPIFVPVSVVPVGSVTPGIYDVSTNLSGGIVGLKKIRDLKEF